MQETSCPYLPICFLWISLLLSLRDVLSHFPSCSSLLPQGFRGFDGEKSPFWGGGWHVFLIWDRPGGVYSLVQTRRGEKREREREEKEAENKKIHRKRERIK